MHKLAIAAAKEIKRKTALNGSMQFTSDNAEIIEALAINPLLIEIAHLKHMLQIQRYATHIACSQLKPHDFSAQIIQQPPKK